MSLQQALKRFSGWDFNGDGRFPTDRVKKQDKKNRNRYRRRLDKRWKEQTLKEYI